MKNKFLNVMILLTLILLSTSMLSANAATVDSGNYGDNLSWNLDDKGVLTISGLGIMQEMDSLYKIPWYKHSSAIKSIVINSGVTSIAGRSFWGCNNLTNIVIPKGVTSIGITAFKYCTSLKNIELPDSISIIHNLAFTNCSNLESVKMSNGITYICGSAFRDCSKLTSVNLPETLEVIDGHVFYGCKSLKCITIPASVTTIGKNAFYGTGINEVFYNGYKKDWENIEIGTGNEQLTNATFNYLPMSIIIQKSGNKFNVTPKGVENKNIIIFACYNDNKMVYINPYVYSGESTIPFSVDKPYDKVKIMVWKDLESCTPLCKPEEF